MAGGPWGVVDPNTEHQVWAIWQFRVLTLGTEWVQPQWAVVRREFTRYFAKLSHGHAAELSLTDERDVSRAGSPRYRVEWRVEDNRSLDPAYRASVHAGFTRFCEGGFGRDRVRVLAPEVRVLAGDSEDGRPRAQLIVMPAVIETTQMWGA